MKYRIERNAEGDWIMVDVWKRGHAVLAESLLNEHNTLEKYVAMLAAAYLRSAGSGQTRRLAQRFKTRISVLARQSGQSPVRVHLLPSRYLSTCSSHNTY